MRCKGIKHFQKNDKYFVTFCTPTTNMVIKQKTSQARYNLTRFADSDEPRHSNLLTQVSQVVKLAERKRLFEGYRSFWGYKPHALFARTLPSP